MSKKQQTHPPPGKKEPAPSDTNTTGLSEVKPSGTEEHSQVTIGSTDHLEWQQKLLGLMMSVLIGITAFFFIVTLVVLAFVQVSVHKIEGADTKLILNSEVDATSGQLYLNASAMNQRYHQGRVLVMSRIWVQYMSFITGMALCMVGATFVLGKLRSETNLKFDTADSIGVVLTSSSPGIVLAVLGSIIICVSLFSDREITISETVAPIPPRSTGEEITSKQDKKAFLEMIEKLAPGVTVDSEERERLESKFGEKGTQNSTEDDNPEEGEQ